MRKVRRFLPSVAGLEPRLVLNAAGHRPFAASLLAAHRAQMSRTRTATQTPLIDFINTQYGAFADDFRRAERVYLAALQAQTTGQATVSASLTQPYAPGSGFLTVDNGLLFGSPSPSNPLYVTAEVNGQTAEIFQVTGVLGDVLTGVAAFDPATQAYTSAGIPLPAGTTQIVASVSSSGTTANAASLFSTYVLQRAQQMTQELVTFLNRLPVKLPRVPGLPRQPGPRNAVQLYTTSAIIGSGSDSLVTSLFSVSLPTDTGPSLVLFDAATGAAIDRSRTALLEGMRLLFSNRGLYAPISTPTTIPSRGSNVGFSGS